MIQARHALSGLAIRPPHPSAGKRLSSNSGKCLRINAGGFPATKQFVPCQSHEEIVTSCQSAVDRLSKPP